MTPSVRHEKTAAAGFQKARCRFTLTVCVFGDARSGSATLHFVAMLVKWYSLTR